MSEHGKKFVKGAIILSIGGIIAKILSAFFRIPLTHLIGDTGLGYYQIPYPIYTMMTSISYVGIPSTISKIISGKLVHKKYYEAHKVFQYTLLLLFMVSGIVTLFMFFGADWLIESQNWFPEVKYSIWGLALSPIFIGIMGVFRGYFQGMQEMFPTATSQIAESFSRTIIGLGAAYIIMKLGYGVAIAAGGAAFGGVAGGVAGTIVLVWTYLKKRKDILKKVKESKNTNTNITFFNVSKNIIKITFPISIGASVLSVMNGVDSALVVKRLIYGGRSNAADLVGQMGKASTFISIPLALAMALVVGLVPATAEAVEKKDKQELKDKIELGTRFALLLGLPSAAGLCVLAQPAMSLIYGKYDAGAEVLSIMSISLVFIILGQTLTGILQGMGHLYIPVVNLVIAAIGKGIINYMLVPGPLGINGAAIGTIVGYGIFAVLNYLAVRKYGEFKLNFTHVILKPTISALIMTGVTFGFYRLLSSFTGNSISTLASILVGVIVYVSMLIMTGAISEEDFSMLPQGNKILSILKKFNIFSS
ncbi:putative polysaccharide biosynthesis protein [Defluviitalea phaphyphila]|uniref:putative polysaccharide biosynthesis protein n=1 Tax=Defluviitalea phaphyphila TaxID=1473580 RepID=UPI00073104FE|nr:polysaccharide biosynthesis protein [Defluviitalea phaphyphila]